MTVELSVIFVIVLLAVAGGYFLSTHVHNIATKTATTITSVEAVPMEVVNELHAKIDSVNSQLQIIASKIGITAPSS